MQNRQEAVELLSKSKQSDSQLLARRDVTVVILRDQSSDLTSVKSKMQ
jgi:methionine aminopeptidase